MIVMQKMTLESKHTSLNVQKCKSFDSVTVSTCKFTSNFRIGNHFMYKRKEFSIEALPSS